MLIRRDRAMVAVTIVLDVAFHGGRSSTVSAADLAERLGLARRGMEPLLQALSRAGILESVRGPRGGYRLARERRRISAGEIVRLVAELEAIDEPELHGASPISDRIVRPMIQDVHSNLMRELDAITIEDLCHRAEEKGLAEPIGVRPDFAI